MGHTAPLVIVWALCSSAGASWLSHHAKGTRTVEQRARKMLLQHLLLRQEQGMNKAIRSIVL